MYPEARPRHAKHILTSFRRSIWVSRVTSVPCTPLRARDGRLWIVMTMISAIPAIMPAQRRSEPGNKNILFSRKRVKQKFKGFLLSDIRKWSPCFSGQRSSMRLARWYRPAPRRHVALAPTILRSLEALYQDSTTHKLSCNLSFFLS